MIEQKYGLLTFHSTHHSLKAEKVLKESGLKIMMIPIPREITANCGTGIKFDLSDLETVKGIIENSNMEIWGYYKVQQKNGEKLINKF